MTDENLIERICRFADDNGIGNVPFPTPIDGLSIIRSRVRTELDTATHGPLLCLVLQGSEESYAGDTHVVYGAGDSLIVSLDLPSISRITEASDTRPYVALTLAIDLGLVSDVAAELFAGMSGKCASCALASGEADAAMVGAMGRLFDLLARPFEQRVMVPLLRREIHFRLILAGHGGLLRRLAHQDSHASRISRSLTHIRGAFTAPVSVAALAEMALMSPSSFHEHFKAVTGTTPLQYQKDMRLLEARRRLATGAPSVATVAFEVGYESATQFSREYQRKFGVSPRYHRSLARPAAARRTAA